MKSLGSAELFVVLTVITLLVGGKKLGDVAQGLTEAIRNFKGGGPGSPSHPIPANDSALLTRKRPKTDQKFPK